MKAFQYLLLSLLAAAIAAPFVWHYAGQTPETELAARIDEESRENEPDMGPTGVEIDKEEYLRARNEQMFLLRGLDSAKQDSRAKAIGELEKSERLLAARGLKAPGAVGSWSPIGPAPIPVGSTGNSGRVSAIAVHPTNPNIVFVGTAQGGLYRSLDGGTTWTPMLDGALSLAIGAVAFAPSDPTIVYVGTGEPQFSADSFFGVGLYRLTNATSPSPTISGPLNKNGSNADIFTGRAVSEIIVHPTDPATVFVSTVSGIAGLGASTTGLTVPEAGLYRTSNGTGANPVFSKIAIAGTLGASRNVIDIAIEPDNPARMIAAVVGSGGDGGIYLSTNATDPAPTFARTLTTGDGSSLGRAELAVNKTGSTVTVFAATGTANGTVFKSVDGGATWDTGLANSFCNPQCFYDMAIAVDPTNVNNVYLGGSPTLVFGRSTNGGASFANSSSGLHVDTQAIAIAPSSPTTVYFGSDGGIWKTTNVAQTTIAWTSLNNSGFSATQFQSLSLHPTDRNYMLGGTQDNGTEHLAPDGLSWVRSDGGDGGFCQIDKNATNTTNVTAYHTYFNSSGSQIGFSRATTTTTNGNPVWSGFLGCGGTANGINCADSVLFYAPMVLGPGNPNSLYFGTNRLYRSVNNGGTMTDVSGTLPARISAIAIAPQNDDVRLVGLTNGAVYLSTTAGATTMTAVTGSIPARYVGRIAIDPTNSNVAYVGLNGFGLAAGAHVWKTTNLLSGTPTWSVAGTGIPDVPVNALAIDPANPSRVYAGTDIGAYVSGDGGTSWLPYSDGLPRVAIFDMAIQPVHRVIRIATHGRGIWERNLASTAAVTTDFDGDRKTDISIFRPAVAEWWINRSSNSATVAAQFGAAGDTPVPADFTGDGKTDIAFFRPSNGNWFVLRSEDSSFYAFPFGTTGDVPVAADFDGDGKADAGVFRPSSNTWFIQKSSGGSAFVPFGATGDLPVPADYDGDGKADIAIFRPGPGQWWIQRSSDNTVVAATFGTSTDTCVPADYTGDGKTDIAFFRPSNGSWFVLRSEDGSFYSFPFGTTGDLPSPGDYDGDGKADPAVFRPTGANWFVNRSTAGLLIQAFGAPTDKPLPNYFTR